MAALTSRSYLS